MHGWQGWEALPHEVHEHALTVTAPRGSGQAYKCHSTAILFQNSFLYLILSFQICKLPCNQRITDYVFILGHLSGNRAETSRIDASRKSVRMKLHQRYCAVATMVASTGQFLTAVLVRLFLLISPSLQQSSDNGSASGASSGSGSKSAWISPFCVHG